MPKYLKNGVFSLVLLALTLITSSCKRDESKTTSDTVSWPELVHLDEVAYRAEGFARTGDLVSVRKSLAELTKAGNAVTLASVPSNVSEMEQVKLILSDLTSLTSGFSPDLDDQSLKTLVLGLHPVIAKLIDAAGMPHLHANEGPNDGFLHPIFDNKGKQVATAEIKLHDDAGDVEIWLTRGGHGGEPWRLPLDTKLSLSFPDLTKTLTLAVRDTEQNADESGASTILDGATAYFVFPGDTGVDASWLTGGDFAAKAELTFEETTTGSFILRPHIHHDDGH